MRVDRSSHRPIEQVQWSKPEYIAEALRELGYQVNESPPADPELIRIAGLGERPMYFPDRVDAVCRMRGRNKPAGFSPSNIRKVSLAKIEEFAANMRVPLSWLIRGTIVEREDDTYEVPDFLQPYARLRSDAGVMYDFLRWYGYFDRLGDFEPWEISRGICATLARAKETERAYWDNRTAQQRYHEETAELRDATNHGEEAVRRIEQRLGLSIGAKPTKELLAMATAQCPDLLDEVLKVQARMRDILEGKVMAIDHWFDHAFERMDMDITTYRERMQGRGTPYLMESSVDPFYKMRSDGESGYIWESIPNTPWVAQILPFIWETEDAKADRQVTLTLTKQEWHWLIDGFHDGVMGPAQGERGPQKTPEHWLKEATRDPGLIKRMHALHFKLLDGAQEIVKEEEYGRPSPKAPTRQSSDRRRRIRRRR